LFVYKQQQQHKACCLSDPATGEVKEGLSHILTMPRLVRRKPLWDRIKDYLNPGDFFLWLSEEVETRELDSTQVGGPVALGLHVIFLIARANSGGSRNSGRDDVFGEGGSGTGWLSYIVEAPLPP
jgi:hypothetical protein